MKQYNERILQVEHGNFTLLVMPTTGGMGRENRKFYARLSEVIYEKRKLCVYWLLDKKKNMFWISKFSLYMAVDPFYYTSKIYSESSLSSFAKISEVKSNVDATLLSFWVSSITYSACYCCVQCNKLMPKI